MMTRRPETRLGAADDSRPITLPQVTYGSTTIRMAIMALIMGGTEGPTGRRA